MPLSKKANEIRARLVSEGKLDYWFGIAKRLVKRKHQYRAGLDWEREVAAPRLANMLKSRLSSQDANDEHWYEFAVWLCKNAP